MNDTTIDAIGLVARFAGYVAILCVVGAVAFRFLILKRSGLTVGTMARGSRRSAAIGAYASMSVVVVDIVKLGIQTDEMRFPTDSWITVGRTMLFETSWGTMWMIQVAVAVLLAMTFTLARKDALPRWNVLALMSMGLAATPAFASHAMSAQRLKQYSIAADVTHVLGASLWIGTLFVMFASILGNDGNEPQSETPRSEMRANYMVSLLRTFSPLALTGAVLVAASGVVSALAHIEHLADLTGTPYGQKLIAKVVCVGMVVLLGWRNWRILTPAVKTEGPRRMTWGMGVEIVVALVVIGVTAALVVTPPPAEMVGR